MANPLFQALGGSHQQNDPAFAQMMGQLQQFKNSFRGDARAEVQRLLQTGQMTQQQYNQLGQMASQIQNMMK